MNLTYNPIADGLADHGFAIMDQFLSQNEVKDILDTEDFKNAFGHFKKAGIGKRQDHQINEAVRGDHIKWIDKHAAPGAVQVYLGRMKELVQFVNQTLYLSLKDFEAHMTIYPAGSFYKRHLDQFRKDDHRKLSVICYLNEAWKEDHGGQLRMYLPEKSIDILPLAGRLVCFRSDQIEHEVLPASRERLSLTGWLLDQYIDLRHL